ncbi:MAG: hypothetical protein K9L86_00195 [Candidatus Omnitrophica bacterium]|nr:hypothetical protein [Candidatus Omnitrophota bacterium]
MLRLFSNKKAQAMVEMAILGPIVLVAVGMLVTYIAKVNNDQYALMAAFRYALAKSHAENKAVAYGTWDDRRMADATSPILGKKTTSSGAGYVLWAIPKVTGQGEDPKKGMWMDVNRFPEYDLGEQASSGSVEPRYFTTTVSTVTASSTSGGRHAGVVEAMIYKIDNKYYGQARGHGR